MKIENFGVWHLAISTGIIVAIIQNAELMVFNNTLLLEFFLIILVMVAFLLGLKLSAVTGHQQSRDDKSMLIASLTAREIDILSHLYHGKTNKEIAAMHSIEVSTVKTHVNNLYTKLQIGSRKEARELYKKDVFPHSPSFIHPS
jgi:DNA-binding CsgD family transcriptional regulator